MQNSELYRRGFVVPLNAEAEQALRNNQVSSETPIEFHELLNDDVFDELMGKGLFTMINAHLGTMIDDYEEEEIAVENIKQLEVVVNVFETGTTLLPDEKFAVAELTRLCRLAVENGRPIFFIF